MQHEVRKYLKTLREVDDLYLLEKELNGLIEESRKFGDTRYNKSPILAWHANRQLR